MKDFQEFSAGFQNNCTFSKIITSALDPVMFADNSNLFYEDKNLKTLFSLVNRRPAKSF